MKQLFASTALVIALAVSAPAAMAGMHGDKAAWHQKMEEKLSVFPADKQELIKKTFAEGKESREATREKVKALREEMKAIVTAPQFDKAAFLAKSNEIQAVMAGKHKERAERMAGLMSQLTQDERQKFVEMMPKGHHRGHHGKGASEGAPKAQ